MNLVLGKRGEGGDNLLWQLAYIILGVIFFIGLFYWIVGYQDGAALWEDYYAKEIAMVVNSAEPGQEVYLDVHKGVAIAIGNGKLRSDIFNFDNRNNEVIVSLRGNGGTSFGFFNDVDVIDWRVELADNPGVTNRLYFRVIEPLDKSGEDEISMGGEDEQ